MDQDDREMKLLSTVVAGLPTKPADTKLQRVLDARMTLSEAIEAATAILSGYPNGGANAGDSYIGALASTLMGYPRQVAMRCADVPRELGRPLRGVAATSRFLPTPADLIAWCEKDVEPLRGDRQHEINLHRQFKERDEQERIERERPNRLNVAELKAKYGDWTQEMATARRRDFGSVRQIDASELTVSPYLREALARREAAE